MWEARYSPSWTFFPVFHGGIEPKDQHKTTFIYPSGTFAYWKIPFGLKNAEPTFERAMTLIFHDLKTIIDVYLDDLVAHSHL